MSAKLINIVKYLDDYLDTSRFKDYCPVGLQVMGKKDVKKIVTGVSACLELFERAVEEEADAIIVHHGMFFDSDPKVVKGGLKKRLKILLENDISLLGYHLVLDAHDEVGNNAILLQKLGFTQSEPFGGYGGKSIGKMGSFETPVPADDFFETVKNEINSSARIYGFGPEKIGQVAIVSGGAPGLVREAIEKKADLYLTGEDTEWIYHLCKEENIHYVAAGHHATERFGIETLGRHLAKEFDVTAKFIDINNPI